MVANEDVAILICALALYPEHALVTATQGRDEAASFTDKASDARGTHDANAA